VFFALAGAGLQLDLLAGVIVPAAIIAIVRGGLFWWGCRRAARATGASPEVEKYVWVGLLPQAGLALALALIMRRTFPGFGDQAAALVLGVVALNQLVTPILLRIALIRSGEAGRRPGTQSDHGH
jgi:Kef-type K+ transport system membrane component KefB